MAPKTNISWMTPSETLLRLGLGGFGDVKWAWGGGWCLSVFFFRISSSPGLIVRFQKRARKWLAGTKMQAQKCDRFLSLREMCQY